MTQKQHKLKAELEGAKPRHALMKAREMMIAVIERHHRYGIEEI